MRDRARDGFTPRVDFANVLRRALIRLQTGEPQIGARRNLFRETDRGRAGLHAATARADVDFDQHIDFYAGRTRRRIERGDIAGVIGADRDVRAAVELGDELYFGCADDFVGDQHILDAALDHHRGLAGLLHADAGGAQRYLAQRDLGALVAFRVRPQADVAAPQRIGQALQIALERIELEHETGRVDLGQRRADFSSGT
jgi:hypothetical protein